MTYKYKNHEIDIQPLTAEHGWRLSIDGVWVSDRVNKKELEELARTIVNKMAVYLVMGPKKDPLNPKPRKNMSNLESTNAFW
jgi:hypothetical protein